MTLREMIKELVDLSDLVKEGSKFIKSLIYTIVSIFIFISTSLFLISIFIIKEIIYIFNEIGKIETIVYIQNTVQLISYSLLGWYCYIKIRDTYLEPEIVKPEEKRIFYSAYKKLFGMGEGISLRDDLSISKLRKETKLRTNKIKRIIFNDFIFLDGIYYPNLNKSGVLIE